MSTTPTVPFPWEPQPQETTGTYRFDGRFVATAAVINDLGNDVVRVLYFIAQGLVKENDGIDYILAFKHRETDEVVWMIDQLNDEMKASAWVCTLSLSTYRRIVEILIFNFICIWGNIPDTIVRSASIVIGPPLL